MYICHIINQTKIFKMKKLMYLLVAGSLSVFTACDGGEAAKDGKADPAKDNKEVKAGDKTTPADKAPKAAPAVKKDDKKVDDAK
jgi:hypothetical protein